VSRLKFPVTQEVKKRWSFIPPLFRSNCQDGRYLKTEKEKNKIYEYFAATHMLCFFILMLDLVLSSNMYNRNIYPFISIRFILLVILVMLGVVLLYHTKSYLYRKNFSHYFLMELAYVVFPLLAVGLTLIIFKDSLIYTQVLFILPVLIASTTMGKTPGLVMSAVCAVCLVFYQVVEAAKPFVQALESELFIISMMCVIGWFTGEMTDIAQQNQERLKANLKHLREEINRRQKAEERLRMLSGALEQSPSSVVIADTGGNIEYVNSKFTSITGYLPGEVTGKNMFELVDGQPHDRAEQIWNVIKAGREWKKELLSKRKNNETYWNAVSIAPFKNAAGEITHFLRVAEDITERKRVEKEMARLEQLNLVGEMAAGIGHEIRNPLTTVSGFLQLLKRKEKSAEYMVYYELMLDELNRANAIITEFLSMAKNKAVNKKRQNLNRILKNIIPLIEADAATRNNYVKIELKDIPDLFLDEKEMRQLIFNLVRNGLEAMPAGGVLTISTYVEGNETVLAVRDQGKGIKPDVLEKIGTPFFTTKDCGTGLGLSVCFSIAGRHDAVINFDTGPAGTVFYVRFKLPDING